MHLIGINGYKRSGKGTVANFITANYTGGAGVVYHVGFADKVKIMAARALGFLDETPRECIALMDEAKERWFINASTVGCEIQEITGREYLQHIGTQARKLFGDDFWVDQVLPRPSVTTARTFNDPAQHAAADAILMQQRFPGVDCVAITDLRFENEAERVLALGGEVWRVTRPGCESDGHDSEQELPERLVSLEIANDRGLGSLESRVKLALETLS